MTTSHHTEPMLRSGSDERDYLMARADVHRQIAEKTDEAGVRAIHLRLGDLYAEQAALIILVLPD